MSVHFMMNTEQVFLLTNFLFLSQKTLHLKLHTVFKLTNNNKTEQLLSVTYIQHLPVLNISHHRLIFRLQSILSAWCYSTCIYSVHIIFLCVNLMFPSAMQYFPLVFIEFHHIDFRLFIKFIKITAFCSCHLRC